MFRPIDGAPTSAAPRLPASITPGSAAGANHELAMIGQRRMFGNNPRELPRFFIVDRICRQPLGLLLVLGSPCLATGFGNARAAEHDNG